MSRRTLIAMAVVLFAARDASAASVCYSLTGGGVQFQIGDGIPLPLQAATTGARTGLIAMSAIAPMPIPPPRSFATSAGFPWTTSRVIVSAPSAEGYPERFTISGMDSRVGGVGTISLVSGALSTRFYSPNANRGWLRLTVPEPGAVAGALTALAALGVRHAGRRRSR